MKQNDHELLIKIEERTNNIWRYVGDIKQHQIDQNGLLKQMCIKVDRNTQWRKFGMSLLIVILGTLITKIVGLW